MTDIIFQDCLLGGVQRHVGDEHQLLSVQQLRIEPATRDIERLAGQGEGALGAEPARS